MFFAPLAAEGGSSALIVHPFWVLVSIVNFLVLLYVLQRFMWGPIMRTLDARAARIREGLRVAGEAKAEGLRMQAEVERLLNEARREAAALSERMNQAAEAAANEVRAQA